MIHTRRIEKRFMQGNLDIFGDIYDEIRSHYENEVFFESIFAKEDIIYSDGFVHAIEMGLFPELEIHESFLAKRDQEYHHLIVNKKCYVAYFNEQI